MKGSVVLLFLSLLIATPIVGVFAAGHEGHQHGEMTAPTEAGFDVARPETFSGFFSRLFSADFMPHGHCYWWKPSIVWLHVLSNALIALSYFAIPIILVYFVMKRKDFPFPGLLVFFGAFILSCGTGHLMDIVTLWHPIYRLDGLVKAVTAGISLATAFSLIPLVPRALALRSPKELEALNQKLQKEVEQRQAAQAQLAQRAQDLDEANRKLREIDRLKDDFLSNVSHELRTPLTLILAPIESLLAGEQGSLNEPQTKQLQSMHNNSVRLFQMVNGILDFAKIGAGRIEVKRESTDVVRLTESILNEFQPVMRQKQLESLFSQSLKFSSVSIDRYLFERILFNLLANAVKFTPEGGRVTTTLSQRGEELVLQVKDTGIGIPKEDQGRIFQRFKQVDSSSTRRFEGTGLGLALVKEFASLLQGDVALESESGQGCLFTVTFKAPPLTDSAEAAPAQLLTRFQQFSSPVSEESAPASPREAEAGAPKILVAEDNPELASYIASLLGGIGQTKVAHDGRQALERVKTWGPDLVLTDVMMPEKDGVTLCREIKGNPDTSHIPVVILTAVTHRDALVRGWEAGADEYLFKPFHPKELLTRVRILLSVSQNRRQLVQQAAELEALSREQAFSSTIAHDLRTPLRGITAYSDLLLKDYGETLEGTAKEYLTEIGQSGRRMDELIEGLLNFFHLSRAELSKEEVDLSAMAASVVKDLRAAHPDRRTAEFVIPPKTLVQADRALLRVVLENLLGNSLKFTSKHARARIELGTFEKDGKKIYFVRDDGAGFDMKYASKLFGVFNRLHGNDEFEGTGIGLASVHRIIARHGGMVWADGQVEKGATVYFSL